MSKILKKVARFCQISFAEQVTIDCADAHSAEVVPMGLIDSRLRLVRIPARSALTMTTQLQYQQPPALLSQYLRALLARGSATPVTALPNLEAALIRQVVNSDKVAAYSAVCGFSQQSDCLPLTYPHLLAFPLHLELMLHREFPLAPMGLVHIRNHITQYRPIDIHEPLDIRCLLGNGEQTDKGLEFDIISQVRVLGELVWESVSTNLARCRSANTARRSKPVRPECYPHQQQWQLPANLGRQYARVSGDSNPIHLYPFSARLFGFRRPIAHGMWSKARVAAALSHITDIQQGQLDVQFKQPIFLPSQVNFNFQPDNTGGIFNIHHHEQVRIHMTGCWQPL